MTAEHTPDMGLPPSNTRESQPIDARDLPLRCPQSGTSLWNSHPRVYIPLDRDGKGQCPYCGTLYKWQEKRKNEK